MEREINNIEDVINYMVINNKNPLKVDAWQSGDSNKIYNILQEFYNDKMYEFDYPDSDFTWSRNAKININKEKSGGMGMGQYPNSYTISVLIKF